MRLRLRLVVLLATSLAFSVAHAAAWLPVTPEELRMTSEPKAPMAAAIVLYRQVDRDDADASIAVYERIKVLTEAGRRYANVQIPFDETRESIHFIEARTIRPDGTAVVFDGAIHDKPLLVDRTRRHAAKVFTMPDVEVGSIIEIRCRYAQQYPSVFDSRWILSDELFIKHARFSLRPSPWFALNWTWPVGLPPGTRPPVRDGGLIRLEARDIPAFVVEERMPPQDLLKFRVEFIYEIARRSETAPDEYWREFAKQSRRGVEDFLYGDRELARVASRMAPPSDPPEVRLRSLFAYAQSFRNRSFERAMTAEEFRRAKLKDVANTHDVLEYGHANATQITWLFLGLVRGAGFRADALMVPTRDRYFFDRGLMNARELNSTAVVVRLDDRDVYLDPGIPFTPFGLLPWTKSAVTALRLDENGGHWVVTPNGTAADSRIVRRANLRLSADGSLDGNLTVTYTGHEASLRRVLERLDDDSDRREFLEADLERDIPLDAEVKLVNAPDWSGTETPLVAEFELKLPGWTTVAGRRMLLPASLFSGGERHVFEHAARVHPLYFEYPYQHVDEVTVGLPDGWRVEGLPKPQMADIALARYRSSAEHADGSLRLRRELTMNMTLVAARQYGTVRGFYQDMRAGDEAQVVIERDVSTPP